MKKKLFILFVISVCLQTTLVAQCSFTPVITPLGSSITVCGSAVLTASPASNTWTEKATMPFNPVGNAVGFGIGSKGYVGTGTNGSAQNKFWEYDPATNAWTQKTDFPGLWREGAAGFSIGSKGYIGCGYTYDYFNQSVNFGYGYANDFYEYDPAGNTWTQKASFPGAARQAPVGFSVGNKGYIGLGTAYAGTVTVYYNDFYEYDPAMNTWATKATFAGGARAYATGMGIGSKGYVGLGIGNPAVPNDFYEYDPANDSWTQKANFIGGVRYYAAGFVINNKGYIGTGNNASGSRTNDLYEYDPTGNTWTQKANLTGSARGGATGFSIGDKGYIGNGNEGGYTNSFYEYSPFNLTYNWSTGSTLAAVTVTASGTYSVLLTAPNGCTLVVTKTVSVVPDATLAISGASAVCAGGNVTLTAITGGATTYTWLGGVSNGVGFAPAATAIYTLTGSLGGCTKTVMQAVLRNELPTAGITPGGQTKVCNVNVNLTANTSGNIWGQRNNFGGGYRGMACAFSIGNKGYMALGWTGQALRTDIWEYDPINDSWTQKANFPATGRFQSVGLSIGNKGYVGMGQYSSNYYNDFWEYDPAANNWTQKASLGVGRQGSVGFSIGGKGYIGTGNNGPTYLNDFWEYDPATDLWTAKASYPLNISSATGFAIGSKGYIGTGYSSYNRNEFYEYDPTFNTWTAKASFLGGARTAATGVSAGGRGYIGLGDNNSNPSTTKDFYEYNPLVNTWTQRTDFPGSDRDFASAFSINNQVFVGLGTFPNEQTDFYEYYPAATYSWSTGNTTALLTTTTSGTYTVTLISPQGCTASASQTVSILPNPTVTINGNNFVCAGGSASLNAVPTGAATYTWTGGVVDNVPFTPTVTAVYSLNSTLGTCIKSYNKTVVVNIPANITPSGLTTVCGTSLNLTASPTGTYSWNTGATTSVLTTTVTGTYSVTVTDPDGCVSGKSQTVSIAPSPTLTASGGTTICQGNTVTLSAAGANTFTWTGGVSNSVAFSPSASAVYTVTGAVGNCTQTVTQTAFVNTFPVSITASGPTTICGSGSVVLTASVTDNVWTTKAILVNSTNARRYAATFSIGNKGYVSTGISGSTNKNDLWEFDPVTNAWTQKVNFPSSARYAAAGFSIGNKGYVGTGFLTGTSSTSNFYEYDPAANVWTLKAVVPGGNRGGAVGFSIGGKGYIGLGAGGTNTGFRTDFYEYDPTNDSWTLKTAFPGLTRVYAAGFSISGKGYIGTGQNGTAAANKMNDFYEYDPSTDTWTAKANVSATLRASATGFSIGNKGYISNGVTGTTTYLNDFLEYNPATDTWATKSNFPGTVRYGSAGFSIGNKGYAGLGGNGPSTTYNDLYEYTPSITYTWSTGLAANTITATATGNYSVTANDNIGCSYSPAQQVIISSIPTLAVTDASICSGNSVVIAPTGADSYTISGGSFTVSPAATTSYTITGSNAGNCAASNTVVATIYVNDSPTLTVNSATICPGSTVALVPVGASTYTISGGSFTVNPLTTTSYTVTGTGSNNCVSNTVVSTVSVNSTLSIAAGSGSICSGNSYSIIASGAPTLNITGGTFNVSPATGTSYTVTGTDASGCTATAVANVTVSATPTLVVSSGSFCEGSSYSIVATGAPVLTISGGTFNVSPAINTSYIVTGTSAEGCTATAISNVTVNATLTLTAGSGTICSGQSYSIVASGAPTLNITGGAFNVSPLANTNYTVTGITAAGCTGTVVATVSVNTTPTVVAASGTICSGNSFSIAATGAAVLAITGGTFNVSPTANTSYTVTGTNPGACISSVVATVSVNTTPTVTASSGTICSTNSYSIVASGAPVLAITGGTFNVSPTANASYTVTGTNPGNCSGSVVATVSVNATPTIVAASGTICSGNSFSLAATGAAVLAITGGTFNVSPTANTSYTVTGTNPGNCTNSVVATVSVNTTPTVTASNGTICSGTAYSIVATGAPILAITGGTFNVSPTANTSYTVTGTNPGNCNGSVVATVSVNATPTIVASNGTICSGNSYSIIASGAPVLTITGGTFNVSPLSATAYTVTGTAANNCTASAVADITVSATPTVVVPNYFICSAGSATIVPTGAGTGGSYSINPGINNFTVNPSSTANYSITATSSANCVSGAVISTVTVLSDVVIGVTNTTICSGNSFVIVPTGASTYTITGGNFTVNPTTTTSYSVTGSVGSCVSLTSAVVTVSVNTTPTVVSSSGTICSDNSYSIIATGAPVLAITGGTFNVSPLTNKSYTITGTNPGNCTGTVVATVSVNVTPTVVASSGTICSGTAYSIVATGAPVLAITGSTFNVSPTASASYTVTGTNPGNCTGTVVATVSVNTTPTVIASSGTICSNNSYSIVATGAPVLTITGSAFNVSPTANTSYTVTGTNPGNCTGTVVATVSVNTTPTVIASNGTICSNNSYSIIATGAPVLAITGGTFNVSPTANASYTVTGTNPGSCTGSVVATVSVNANPTVVASNGTICSGASYSIIATGAPVLTITGGTFNVHPTANTAYTVTGTNSSNCTHSVAATVSVNASPTLVVSSGSICSGLSYSIVATGAPALTVTGGTFNVAPLANTAYTVTGLAANNCTSTAISNVIVKTTPTVTVPNYTMCVSAFGINISPAGAGAGGSYSITGGSFFVIPSVTTSYSVTATSSDNCVSNEAVTTVTVFTPAVNIANNVPVCSGNTLVLVPSGANTYTITGGSFTISPTATSNYSLTGFIGANCISPRVVITVTVNPTPTVVASSGTICSGNSYSIAATGASTLAITGGTFNVAPTANTSYTVTGTNAGSCTHSVVATVSVNATPTIIAGSGTICSGNSYSISASGASAPTITGGTFNVSPIANTSYTVTGTNPGNCTNSAVATVSVNTTPTVAASSGTICSGTAYSIVATGAPVLAITGGTFNVSPVTNASYTVTGTNPGNCTGSAVATVSVNTTPTVVTASGTICSGNSFSIVSTGAAALSITGSTFNVSPAANASYTVTGTNPGNCTNSVVATVSVNTTPTVVASSGTICSGTAYSIAATGAPVLAITGGTFNVAPTANTSYTVTGTNPGSCTHTVVATVSVNTTPTVVVSSASICTGSAYSIVATGAASMSITGGTFNVSPTANTSYTVTGTNPGNCTNAVAITLSVNIGSTLTVSSGSVCSGSSYSIAATGTGSPTLTVTGGTFNVSPLTTTAYTVTGLAANGCTNTAVSNVTVAATPTLAVSSGSICSGNSYSIVASGAPALTITGGTFNVAPVTNTTYIVTGTAANSCTASAVANISVMATPTITVNNYTICSGKSTTITPAGATYYTINGFTGNTYIASPLANASYTTKGVTANGCNSANTATSVVTVVANPTVFASSGIACSASAYSIVASGAPTLAITGGTFNVTPLVNTNYTVTGTALNGCTATAVSNVTASPSPTITVPNYSICLTKTVTVIAGGTGTGGTYIINGVTGNTYVTTPGATTTYTVAGTSTAGCLSANTATSSITVFTVPVVSVPASTTICSGGTINIAPTGAGTGGTYTVSGGNFNPTPVTNIVYTVTGTQNGCISNPALLTVSVNASPTITVNSGGVCLNTTYTITPGGANTYTMNSAGTFTASGNNFLINPTVTTTYSVTGTGTNNCLSTVTGVATITISPLPVVTINSGDICPGNAFTFVATGANTYTYTGSTGTVSATFTPAVSDTYSVMGTSALGCVSSNTAISNVGVVNTVTLSVFGNLGICTGQNTDLSANGATSYSWSTSAMTNTINVNPVVNTNYTVTGSTGNCTNSTVVTITVNALPVVTVTGGSICKGKSFTITPSGADTYVYTTGNAVITPTGTTTFSVTGTSTAGCISAAPAVATVTVNALPNVVATSTIICISETATLNASGATSYAWSNGQTGASITVTPTANTSYTVIGTDANSCSKSAIVTQLTDPCLGFNKISNSISFGVYPNPNSGEFVVETSENVDVIVMNALGQVVHTEKTTGVKTIIDIRHLNNGIYFVKAVSNGHQNIVKIIKE